MLKIHVPLKYVANWTERIPQSKKKNGRSQAPLTYNKEAGNLLYTNNPNPRGKKKQITLRLMRSREVTTPAGYQHIFSSDGISNNHFTLIAPGGPVRPEQFNNQRRPLGPQVAILQKHYFFLPEVPSALCNTC